MASKVSRDERAKRREAAREPFYRKCAERVDKCMQDRRNKLEDAKRQVEVHRASVKEQQLVKQLYDLENRLVALKKNGFTDADIVKLRTHLEGGYKDGVLQYDFLHGDLSRYTLHFAAYLDAFELYEAMIRYGVYNRYTCDSMDTVHFCGHKDFMSKATSLNWKTSGWFMIEQNPFGFAKDDMRLLQARLEYDRPKYQHDCYHPSPYRLRSLCELLS